MQKKFMIFFDQEERPSIYLDYVNYHREIERPSNVLCHGGGGLWQMWGDTLRLYDLSGDFGKYDKKAAREAFDNKRVYYLDECVFDDYNVTNLVLE